MHVRELTHKQEESNMHLDAAKKGLMFADAKIRRLEQEVGQMRLHNATVPAFGAIEETNSPQGLDYDNPFNWGGENSK
jgi:hypothetical protein